MEIKGTNAINNANNRININSAGKNAIKISGSPSLNNIYINNASWNETSESGIYISSVSADPTLNYLTLINSKRAIKIENSGDATFRYSKIYPSMSLDKDSDRLMSSATK